MRRNNEKADANKGRKAEVAEKRIGRPGIYGNYNSAVYCKILF